MRKVSQLCASLIAIGLLHNSVLAQQGASVASSCAAHMNTLTKEPSLGDLLSCLAEMQRAIDELSQGQRVIGVDAQAIPSGAVVAFAAKCPPKDEGWSLYEEA